MYRCTRLIRCTTRATACKRLRKHRGLKLQYVRMRAARRCRCVVHAAETYHETTNSTLIVKSAVRSKQRQGEIYWRNCFDGVYTGCVHPTGRYGVPKNLLYNATSENEVVQLFIEFAKDEGHVGGHAVDVWPIEADGYVANTTLMEHMRVSMLHSGLCRLDTEAWHFSLGDCVNVSTYQRDGTVYDPVSCDCLWDYSLNRGE